MKRRIIFAPCLAAFLSFSCASTPAPQSAPELNQDFGQNAEASVEEVQEAAEDGGATLDLGGDSFALDAAPDSHGGDGALEAERVDFSPDALEEFYGAAADGVPSKGSSDGYSDLEEKVFPDELSPLVEAEDADAGPGAASEGPPDALEIVADDFAAEDGEAVPETEPLAFDDALVSDGEMEPAPSEPPEDSPDISAAHEFPPDDSVPAAAINEEIEADSAPVLPEEEAADGVPVGDGEEKSAPLPSRSMTVRRNQLIEVVYPGKGWIYQGSIDGDGNIDSRSRNFIFGGRKLGGAGQSFMLRARRQGTFLLHFYKNDVLSGECIDDYLEVIVGNEQDDSGGRIVAPDYAEIVPPKPLITAETVRAAAIEAARRNAASDLIEGRAQSAPASDAQYNSLENGGGVQSDGQEGISQYGPSPIRPVPEDSFVKTVVQTTESAPDSLSPLVKSDFSEGVQPERNPAQESEGEALEAFAADVLEADFEESGDELLALARRHYDLGEYSDALKKVVQFFDKAAERIDEGLYLQGQILEGQSEVQNIKGAIDSYDLLVRNWPASAFWDDANRRSIFLKRFYINIR